MKTKCGVSLALALAIAPAMFGKHEHQWQTGRVIESGREKRQGSASVYTDPAGNQTVRPHVVDEDSWVIEAPDRFYVVGETVQRVASGGVLTGNGWRMRKGANLIPGEVIQYCVEGRNLRIRGSDGKEHRLEIVREAMK